MTAPTHRESVRLVPANSFHPHGGLCPLTSFPVQLNRSAGFLHEARYTAYEVALRLVGRAWCLSSRCPLAAVEPTYPQRHHFQVRAAASFMPMPSQNSVSP